MQKRGFRINIFLVVGVFFIYLLALVAAANATTTTDTSVTTSPTTADVQTKTDISTQPSSVKFDTNAKLTTGAGITPDSNFYFVEKVFEKTRGPEANLKKKTAEIVQMIQEKKYAEARVALERFKQFADQLEKEVTPETKDQVQKTVAEIHNAIANIESQIPADQKEAFDTVNKKTSDISKAAEVASKIKELCETLSKIDPEQYSRVCRTEKDAPAWQKKLDTKLTGEQKKEAESFGTIMKECMQTQGKQCRCQDITIKPFAERCAVVAPLADACENKKDKEACTKMEEATRGMDELLPDYLQETFANIEGGVRKEQFNNFAPPECQEAGATTPEACMKIMFETHAPEECKQALKEGKLSFKNEREARQQCEEIMFKANAPEECVAAGVKDQKECGKFMFKQNAPQECIDGGITGEFPNDGKKCEQLMRLKGNREGPKQGQGFALGRNCKDLQDKDAKLKCFEEAFSAAQEGGFKGNGEGFEQRRDNFQQGQSGPRGNWPEPCVKAGIDGKNPDDGARCSKIMQEQSNQQRQQGDEQRKQGEERQRQEFEARQGREQQFQQRPGEFREGQQCPPGQNCGSQNFQPPSVSPTVTTEPSKTESSPSGSTTPPAISPAPSSAAPSSGSGGGESSGSPSSGGSGGEGGGISTGSVIAGDNAFLKYYFRS